MKKLNKPLSKEFSPVKIYLDDLESIEELFPKRKRDYKIETEKFEFSNVGELNQKLQNEVITNLKIYSSDPYINVEFHKMWARLYVGSNDNTVAGVFYKLEQIISSCTRRPSFLYSHYTLLIGYFLFTVIKVLSKGSTYQIVSFLNYGFLIWALWVIYIRLSKHSEIILSKRHDFQSFLIRNKDQIVVGGISAILGVIGTIIAYKLGLLR